MDIILVRRLNMRNRRLRLWVTVMALIGMCALGQASFGEPEFSLSKTELTELTALQSILSDYVTAPGWMPDWGDFEFARYVGGRLASLGYETRLAHAGDRWWVVVLLSEQLAVPVIPGFPAVGEKPMMRGVVLGRVAGTWGGGIARFEQKYLEWEELLPLPPNRPPAAAIRALQRQVLVGTSLRFLGVLSADPDGAIVRYIWDFGDGERSFGTNATHRYKSPGRYIITLTVVDEGGLASSTTIEVSVLSEGGEGEDGSGCGCGG